jgi:archaemetzincin
MAYYAPRERYRAEKLLDWLESEFAGENSRYLKIVGLTESDISTTKGDIPDWGVFGLGSLGGKTCVISTRRLRPKEGQPRTILVERLVKVINHEIGHTFGLEHCPTDRCLMQDALGTVRTVDREDGNFCPVCAAKLGENLK